MGVGIDPEKTTRFLASDEPRDQGGGASRGSAPSQNSPLAMMQNPVEANHTMAPPTNAVKASHYGLWTIDSTDATEMLTPTAA